MTISKVTNAFKLAKSNGSHLYHLTIWAPLSFVKFHFHGFLVIFQARQLNVLSQTPTFFHLHCLPMKTWNRPKILGPVLSPTVFLFLSMVSPVATFSTCSSSSGYLITQESTQCVLGGALPCMTQTLANLILGFLYSLKTCPNFDVSSLKLVILHYSQQSDSVYTDQ